VGGLLGLIAMFLVQVRGEEWGGAVSSQGQGLGLGQGSNAGEWAGGHARI